MQPDFFDNRACIVKDTLVDVTPLREVGGCKGRAGEARVTVQAEFEVRKMFQQ